MCFKNEISGEVLSHKEFVLFVWSEAKKQFTNAAGQEAPTSISRGRNAR